MFNNRKKKKILTKIETICVFLKYLEWYKSKEAKTSTKVYLIPQGRGKVSRWTKKILKEHNVR